MTDSHDHATKSVVVYIDEKEDERDNFFTDAFDSGFFGEDEILILAPLPDLDEMVAHLLELEIDAFVTDFNLTETASLNYSGEDLVAGILRHRPGFPCFIRTAYAGDALNSSSDVNTVYSKDVKQDAHGEKPLFERIRLQISKHRQLLSEWQNELQALTQIPAEERTVAQEERMIELDHLFEQSISAQELVPKGVKAASLGRRHVLLDETDRLIDDIRNKLNGDEE